MYEREKEVVRQVLTAPPPKKKRKFFRQNRKAEITMPQFWLIQAGYIHKWVWALSLLVFVLAVCGAGFLQQEMIWSMSALLPFVAAATVTETARSAIYGMEELEMASRFSLKSVLLARMGALGTANALLILLLVPVCRMGDGIGLIRTGVYLLTPYLLTTVLSCQAVRKLHDAEAVYVCLGISAGVGAFWLFIKLSYDNWFQSSRFVVWIAAAAVLAVFMKKEISRAVRLAEEYVWN